MDNRHNHFAAVSFLPKASVTTGIILSAALLLDITPAYANSVIEDSSLTGNIFFWNRDRERKDVDQDKYRSNIRQSTFNANLDFKSGYLADRIAIELGGYGAWEVSNGGSGHPNEIGFSGAKTRWSEDWEKDISGLSFYKAQMDIKLSDTTWAKIGYIQPSGQTLLAPHWGLLPGTYRGAEMGTTFDFDDAGSLAMSYMWSDKYKAPWYKRLYNFRRGGSSDEISFLHSFGLKYDFKNNMVIESAVGQAHNYMNQFFGKASYKTDFLNNPLNISYQFYGAKDQNHSGQDIYDGLAWLQAITLQYQVGPVGLRAEGAMVKADGEQGFFLQRMTPDYASSNGRLDIWWNSRSDFNANGEKALFAEISYDLNHINSYLNGWRVAASYAYGWDAKPSSKPIYDQNQRLRESAWNLDLAYTVPEGRAKNTTFQLHYTNYDNHTNIPSWSGGYGNIFQDERDIKFIVTIPFTVL